jgi:hypothetical protein
MVQALAWSVLLPAFQGQDEADHFAYVQRVVETGKPTWSALETLPRRGDAFSREQITAMQYGSFGPLSANVQMRPYGTELDEDRYEDRLSGLTDRDRESNRYVAAMRNPPAYYLYEVAVYAPLQNTSLMTRQYVMRWSTIPFFLVAVWMAWLLAGEVFGRRRWLQSVTALFVALQPMLAQLGGIVNPDAAIAALFGVALWLSAVIVRRGATRPRVVAAAATGVAALLTHPRAAPVVMILLAALAVRAVRWSRERPGARRPVVTGIVAGTTLLVAAHVWFAIRGEVSVNRVREFASYLWQFYLPKPPFMNTTVRDDWGVRDVFVDRLWSYYLKFDIELAPGILDAIATATMIGAVLVVATMIWRRDAVRRRLGLAVVLGVAVVAQLLVLHAGAWRELLIGTDPILTGRYLTPLLPIAGLSVAAVAGSLPRRIGPGAATVVLGLEALVALAAFGAAVVRFHA